MKMNQVLLDVETKNSTPFLYGDVHIHGIADNSKDVQEGYVFVAIEGTASDGHAYIGHAVEKGASFVVGEQDLSGLSVPYIQVENSRKALGVISKNFYCHPSKKKIIIGITGTNGKTTTSHMLKHLLESSGKTCSLIGTIHNVINGEKIKSSNTTPSALALQQLLALSNDEVVIMEVSSHALAQHRIEGIPFDFCLFTNLEPEHLDFHKTIENYYQTKLALFNQLKPQGIAVVNIDNSWGEKLANTLQSKGQTVYAIGKDIKSDLQVLEFDSLNSMVSVKEKEKIVKLFSSMSGMHNLYNLLMAYGTSALLDIEQEDLLKSAPYFNGVEGRFEIFKSANGPTIVVDYAHTPDAISHCLKTAKLQGAEKIIHIFGFRGDRDASKRKAMLAAAAEISDQYILTFDDLNSVSADEMQADLKQLNDFFGNSKGTIIPDRTLAIEKAINDSKAGEWIVITGKGHEKYQQSYHLPTESDQETINFICNSKLVN